MRARQARLLPPSTHSRCLAAARVPAGLVQQEVQAASSRFSERRSRRCSSFSRCLADSAERVRAVRERAGLSSRPRSVMRCVARCPLSLFGLTKATASPTQAELEQLRGMGFTNATRNVRALLASGASSVALVAFAPPIDADCVPLQAALSTLPSPGSSRTPSDSLRPP